MTIIKRFLALFMIPVLLTFTLVILTVPLTAYTAERLTPFEPQSADSLPIEEDAKPRQQALESSGGSNWWKWALGIALIGGVAAAAGGGGGGGGSDSGSGTTTVTGSW